MQLSTTRRKSVLVLSLCVLLPLAINAFAPNPKPTSFVLATNGKSYRSRSSELKVDGRRRLPSLSMSSEVNDDNDGKDKGDGMTDDNLVSKLKNLQEEFGLWKKLPPFNIEDTSLLYYDVFLIVNLALSISFWVTHRLELSFLPAALSEGSLMSLLWICAGLFNGAFLYSAKDGHFGSSDERGGPKAAGLLGFSTFLNAINLRLVVALVMAFTQHRHIGSTPGEEIMALEMGFGLILMSCFRFVYSSMVPR
jgi:hypothetical protein